MSDKINTSSNETKYKIEICREFFDKGLNVFGNVLWYGFYILMFTAICNLILFPFKLNFVHEPFLMFIGGIMSIIMIFMFELICDSTPLNQINKHFHIFGWRD